jgi:molybdopterin molybdotransferase
MISVEAALAQILRLSTALPAETVPLRASYGRWMAAPETARLTQSPFAASAMDGYALPDAPKPGAIYQIIGEAAAGASYAGRVAAGQAVRIFTGAPVPEGALHVVIQEDVIASGAQITIGPNVDQSPNIRQRGQDFVEGDSFGPKRLGPADLGLLAAMNVAEVSVRRRPVVAILATGDELVSPGEPPGPSQIIASSAIALAALAEAEGAVARILPIARDTIAHLSASLALADGADVIVTLGGASVGDHDLIGLHAADLGLNLAFWKVALRPGKPMMAGRMGRAALLGLPGNPVSAYVCAVLFLAPLLRALQGDPAPIRAPLMAKARTALAANGPRRHFMRASFAPETGEITPQSSQDSALMRVLAQSNALLIRPENAAAAAPGDMVPFLPLP